MRPDPDPRTTGRRSAGILVDHPTFSPAAYARMSDDDSLRKMADRIQARAVARVQELLTEYPDGHGGNRKTDQVALEGNLISRREAATEAGLSPKQYRNAMDVGRVPKDQFEALVESDDPPSVTKLAAIGRATRRKEERAQTGCACRSVRPP